MTGTATVPMALMTVEGKGAAPTIDDAARQLGVAAEDIDRTFGVVPLDASRGLYSVRVRADRLPAGDEVQQPYRGPFSDPTIAPFGHVQAESTRKK